MEIERKWMVTGWPTDLEAEEVYLMDQGYISVRPTVRIRREELVGVKTEHVLCFKGSPIDNGLAREEIETVIDEELYQKLKNLIGLPLIHKERRQYRLADGHVLEVNSVDPGTETAFSYAEVEFESLGEAKDWQPANAGLAEYLKNECTGIPGSSMGEYWMETRLGFEKIWNRG
ncbi:MAG: hypothetical protein Q4B73_06060 [Lachnospiraceae bacterium]|nr:hypothetical protein [Lachnospiraceae bacterium]